MESAFRCSLCCEEFNSCSKLNVHIESQHEWSRVRKKKNFKCNVCGYEFRLGKYLIAHMRTHTGERPFKCKVSDCGKAFKQYCTLSNHIKYKHSDDARPFKCEFPGCRHSAKTSTNLFLHKKVHSDERPFPCPNAGCNFRAKLSGNLAAHVANVHSGAKAFACSKCDYKTARNRNLNVHMRRHSSRRDFKCSLPHCEKSFKSSSDLQAHMSRKHGDRNIPCDHPSCEKKFANARALGEHKRRVHAKRGHTCPHLNCSLCTNTARTLADHIKVHEESNDMISCSMGQVGLADSTGFACMLCDFVGYSYGAALDHAKFHRQTGFPIDKLYDIPDACLGL